VTFALPDDKLGEAVGAAVVLRPGASATEKDLRVFASQYLADFKVPSRVVFVEELPKGPTGKPQRLGLASRLGLGADVPNVPPLAMAYLAPRTPMEERVAELCTQVLRVDRVSMLASFLELGGDSILATQFLTRVQETLNLDLSPIEFFDSPTLADLAVLLTQKQAAMIGYDELAALLAEIEQSPEQEA
jgi:acyl carrier protein